MHLDGYVWRPTTNYANDPILDVVDGVVLHVDAGNATSLFKYFDSPAAGGIESTAFLPKSAKNQKEQYRSTNREADAQLAGNSWVIDGRRHGLISLETQGYGTGIWNKYQLDGIKDLILQAHEVHKFPLQVITGYHGRGIGYHAMFDEWNPNHHSCPGPDRIKQFKTVIVPWLKEQNKPKTTYTVKKGDTAPKIAKKFKLAVWQLWRLNPGVSLPLKAGQKLNIKW